MAATPIAPWGVMLPNFDPFELAPPPLVPAAREAERLGFDAGWVGDHLAFHPPILEATAALAAAAHRAGTMDERGAICAQSL